MVELEPTCGTLVDRKTGRVLVVDDDRNMVRTFVDLLEVRGWQAAGAFSGEDAVAAIQQSRFDAVLMDIRMSGMNGVQALSVMKKRQPHLSVILMTAFTEPELVERAREEGASDILDKPVPLDHLMVLLERAVEEKGDGP